MADKKLNLLFVYNIEDENLWKDGLWAAINLLERDFSVTRWNIHGLSGDVQREFPTPDFVLGWGAFGSPVEQLLQGMIGKRGNKKYKVGLCIGGYSVPTKEQINAFDILFVETQWSKDWLEKYCSKKHPPIHHAFGINSDIFKPLGTSISVTGEDVIQVSESRKIWDYLTVGSFSLWKRQEKICAKDGAKMAIGQIQKDNLQESIGIIGNLLLAHCGVSDMVYPQQLANFYHAAKNVYIPAELNGGGERAVLEARACEIPVEIEPDNPKLEELLTSEIWNHEYYSNQLREGILSCV